ncbi:MAG: sugar transferase [Candidatus Binatia bacterium]
MKQETILYPLSREIPYPLVPEYSLKRAFDFILACMGLVLSLPLWLIIALAIKMEDGGPLFYRQERVGKGGKKFTLMKFRSMVPDAERQTGPVWAFQNDPRVTGVGHWLRVTAMDELPQLWNILRGDISFVGPRAERPKFVEQFRQEIANYDLRHTVQPGLTGLAQIYGSYDSDPKEKFRYECLYIKKQCFLLDLKLILLSFWITFRGKWQDRGKKF